MDKVTNTTTSGEPCVDCLGRDRFAGAPPEQHEAPAETRETPTVWRWIERHIAGNGPIRRVELVDVRQSMANGGGPACLRLRVVADPQTVDPRFLVDEAELERIAEVVSTHWPEEIDHADLQRPSLISEVEDARSALLQALDLGELG